jgi:hypothetical protein
MNLKVPLILKINKFKNILSYIEPVIILIRLGRHKDHHNNLKKNKLPDKLIVK